MKRPTTPSNVKTMHKTPTVAVITPAKGAPGRTPNKTPRANGDKSIKFN